MSFYANRKYKFLEVPDNGEIETEAFLLASQDSVINLLDILGPKAFAFVKADVNGNISKLKARYDENPSKYKTLTAIVLEEIEQGTTRRPHSATDALLWLTRGLHYMSLFICNMLQDEKQEESLKHCMQDAYNKSLKPYHPWVVHKGVQIAFMAMPYRSQLMHSLSNGVDQDILKQDIQDYHDLLQGHVDTIKEFYQQRQLERI
ncbi:glycolipid transfer protein-like [Amphiura filiformis]|uniref:glycolipid transfer protein-like n=1 Tax=Amphiura filiformis TaxID=82378 RepID=UPI003B21F5F9